MNNPGGKGDKRRPTLRPQLAHLGDAIWRERDPDKKAALIEEWHKLKWGINEQTATDSR